jgi:hypothetical protein
MKQIAILIAAMLATSGSAYARDRTVPIVPVSEAPRECPLTVSFGSYAMGIDGTAFAKVTKLLSHDRRVTRIEQFRWGREGEVTLCARTRSRAEAVRLFGSIRALLPKKPRGPVTVTTDRLRFTAPRE